MHARRAVVFAVGAAGVQGGQDVPVMEGTQGRHDRVKLPPLIQ